MKLEELIEKVGRFEKKAYEVAQMASDLRVLIVGLYDQIEWWREKYYDMVGEDIE